ncbi:MAG: hypothetical protein LW716_05350, partial [Microcystis sp. 53602_E8]|nr:hypothetical protein [Microcystis sp. 53602_E8]
QWATRSLYFEGQKRNQFCILHYRLNLELLIQQALIKDFLKISGHSRSPLPCSLNQSFRLNRAVLPRTPGEL